MTIPNQFDNITFDRRVVAAHYHGKLEALLESLQRCGHQEITFGDLEARAEVVGEMWRLNDPEKPTCYGCCADVTPGVLCDCYEAVIPGRKRNVNDAKLLAALEPSTIVEVYCCTRCGDLDDMTAADALGTHQRFGAYRPRKYCTSCFAEQKTEGRPRGRRGKRLGRGPTAQAQAQAPSTSTSSTSAQASSTLDPAVLAAAHKAAVPASA